MRIRFADHTSASIYEGWYSSDNGGSEPQLIIRYQS
jgi:hypothetical protein